MKKKAFDQAAFEFSINDDFNRIFIDFSFLAHLLTFSFFAD